MSSAQAERAPSPRPRSSTPIESKRWHEGFVARWVGTELRYSNGPSVVRLNRLHPTSEGLTAFVEVHDLDSDTLLHAGRWDLMGSTTLARLAKQVATRCRDRNLHDPGWEEAIHEIVYDAIQLHLQGESVVRLAEVEPDRRKFLLRPLIGATGATAIIARGGSFKSALTLCASLAVASGRTGYLGMKPDVSGPVLYLDWEADAATHAERAQAMALDPADLDNLLYQYQKGRPLASSVEQIKRVIDDLGVVMCVIDSVMLARGGDANGPEATIGFFAAIGALDVPCLLVDHKSRAAIRSGESGAYGSIINENSIRLAWEIRGIHELPTGTKVIKLVPGKRNNFGRLGDLAFEVTIDTDDDDVWRSARFRPTNPKVVVANFPDEDGNLHDRIIDLMVARRAPLEVKEIASTLEVKEDSVRKTLNRSTEFANVAPGGTGMWVLTAGADRYLTAHLPDPYP